MKLFLSLSGADVQYFREAITVNLPISFGLRPEVWGAHIAKLREVKGSGQPQPLVAIAVPLGTELNVFDSPVLNDKAHKQTNALILGRRFADDKSLAQEKPQVFKDMAGDLGILGRTLSFEARLKTNVWHVKAYDLPLFESISWGFANRLVDLLQFNEPRLPEGTYWFFAIELERLKIP